MCASITSAPPVMKWCREGVGGGELLSLNQPSAARRTAWACPPPDADSVSSFSHATTTSPVVAWDTGGATLRGL